MKSLTALSRAARQGWGGRLRQQFQALDDGRPLILLCFERRARSGANCHRRRFAEYWELHTGEIIPEIGGRTPEQEE